jgi:hypothetical protein
MRTPRAAWLTAAFALLVLLPSAAGAATAKEKAEAKALAAQARSAVKEQRFDDAVEALRHADQLDPGPQLKLDLSRALIGAGKLVEASTILHQLEGVTAKTLPEKKVQGAAKKLLGELETRIPWIQVTVAGPKEGEATTTLDGQEVDATSEVPVDPGEHEVAVEAKGWKRAEKRVKVAEGAHEAVKIKLEREAAPAPPPPPPESGGSKVPAAIAFGVGAAGTGVGAVFGLLAFNKTTAAKDSCKDNVCPDNPAVVKTRDQAVQYGNVSTVGFIVGGVGVATGIVLLITSSGSSEPAPGETKSAWVRPWVGPGQAGVLGQF